MVNLVLNRLERLVCRGQPEGVLLLSRSTATTMLIALAKLRAPVPPELHVALLQSVSHLLDSTSLHQLPLLCWGVCGLAQATGNSMQLRPGSDLRLLPRIQQLTRAHLAAHAYNSADLLQLLTSFARASVAPDPWWLELHEACVVRLMRQGQLPSGVVAGLLDAYKSLRCYHPETLLGILKGMMAEQRQQLEQREMLRERRMRSANDRTADGVSDQDSQAFLSDSSHRREIL